MTILDWRLMRERDPVVYYRHLGESPVLSIYEVDLTVTLVSPCVYMLAVIEKFLLGIRCCTSYAISCSKQSSSNGASSQYIHPGWRVHGKNIYKMIHAVPSDWPPFSVVVIPASLARSSNVSGNSSPVRAEHSAYRSQRSSCAMR